MFAFVFDLMHYTTRIRRSLDADSAATLVHAFVTSLVDYYKSILAAAPKTTMTGYNEC